MDALQYGRSFLLYNFRRVDFTTLLFLYNKKYFFTVHANINKYYSPPVQATNKLPTVKNINKKTNSLKIASIPEVSPFKAALMDRIKKIVPQPINEPIIFIHLPFHFAIQTFVCFPHTITCNSKCSDRYHSFTCGNPFYI